MYYIQLLYLPFTKTEDTCCDKNNNHKRGEFLQLQKGEKLQFTGCLHFLGP